MEIERRYISTELAKFELRKNDDGKATGVRGYAAVFDVLSLPMWGFREKIDPEAFKDVLDDDVRALFNHDPNFILARSLSGTLEIGTDEIGLWYDIEHLPASRGDVAEAIERGDLTQSSFAFRLGEDKWTTVDKEDIRTLVRFDELRDVAPVTYPAYPEATVGKRSEGSASTRSHDEYILTREAGIIVDVGRSRAEAERDLRHARLKGAMNL